MTEFLRHTVGTIAYRGSKALRNAPDDFADFQPADGVRTPVQILAHMGDLFDWSLGLIEGRHEWHESAPLAWHAEVDRFFTALKRFDEALAGADPAKLPAEKLFQGPIADALTHIGQLAILRRMAAHPVKPENYFKAAITAGSIGLEQARPVHEFD